MDFKIKLLILLILRDNPVLNQPWFRSHRPWNFRLETSEREVFQFGALTWDRLCLRIFLPSKRPLWRGYHDHKVCFSSFFVFHTSFEQKTSWTENQLRRFLLRFQAFDQVLVTSHLSRMSSSTTSIEDLPPEMINELFKHLHPRDLVACSLVNKRWSWIYSNFKLHRLAAIFSPSHSPWKWYATDIKFEDKEICHQYFFCDIAKQPIVSNLRYLALFASFSLIMDLNKLNRFSQLLHLEFECRWLTRGKLHLNFPQLKVLVFHKYNERYPVSVDCPQLGLLAYRGEPAGSNLLEVKQPETIRKLETNMLGEKLTSFKKMVFLLKHWIKLFLNLSMILSILNLYYYY